MDLQKIVRKVDRFQQKHSITGFSYAVIRKYGDDQGGYQAALLTYYGFLSIFPLLLIVTTIAQLILQGDPHLKAKVITSTTTFFPVIGSQLQQNVHGFGKTGLPLLLGLVVLLYGVRGVADAFRHMVNHVWSVPIKERSGFFPALGRSFAIIGGGGCGFLVAAILASYTTANGHAGLERLLLGTVCAVVLFVTFIFVIQTGLNKKVSFGDIWRGAAVATIGLLLLQSLGGYLLIHQLKNLDNLYGTFAVVLGLLFWLYLQTQIVVYAIEVDTVRVMKLWPRSILT